MSLRVELLGGFRVLRDGQPVTGWKTEQAKDFFKILLTSPGQYFLRDQLIDYIWPDSDYEKSKRSLRTRVHELRKVIEPGVPIESSIIETANEVYRIRPDADLTIDVQEFEQFIQQAQRHQMSGRLQDAIENYQKAIELYKGDYLPEDRYKEWAISEHQRWRRIYLTALQDQSDCWARQGKYQTAIDRCLRSLEIDDCQEDVYRQTMLYYHLLENRGKALSMYNICKQAMADHLETSPSEATERLHQQIVDGFVPDVDNIYPPTQARIIAVPTPEKLPFIGRQSDYDKLIALLEKSIAGEGQLAIIRGRAGVGKSRLAQEVCTYARAEKDVCLLQGETTIVGKSLPYQSIVQALEGYLAQYPSLDSLPRQALDAWSPLLPQIEMVGTATLPPQEARIRLFKGFVSFIHTMVNRHGALVIYLDNLHWANASTLALLDYALPQIKNLPVMLLTTSRVETLSTDHTLSHFFKNLGLEDEVTRGHMIELENLNIGDIHHLLNKAAPDLNPTQLKAISQTIYNETCGSPLYVRAVLKEFFTNSALSIAPDGTWQLEQNAIAKRATQMPADIQSLLLQQLERLDQESRQLLEYMSVFGTQVEECYLRQVWQAQRPDERVTQLEWLKLVESLENAMLIRQKNNFLVFDHDRVQEVVYASLKDFKRKAYHELAIEALETLAGPMTDLPHGLLVHHCFQANRLQDALNHLTPALEEAVNGYRNQEALQLAQSGWDAANQLIQKGQDIEYANVIQWEILLFKERIFNHMTRWPEQAETLEVMTTFCNEFDSPEAWMTLHELKGRYGIRISDFDLVMREANTLIELSKTHGRKDIQAHGLRLISNALMNQGDNLRAMKYVEQEQKLGPKETVLEQAQLEYYIAGLCLRTSQFEKTSDLMESALKMFTEVNAQQEIACLLIDRAILLRRQGNVQTSLELLKQAQTLCSEIGLMQIEARALGNIGLTLTRNGDYESACSYLHDSIDLFEQLHDKRGMANDTHSLGWTYFCLGDLVQAKLHYENALALNEEVGLSNKGVIFDLAMVESRAENKDEALSMMEECLEKMQKGGDRNNEAKVWRSMGEIHLDEDRFEQAFEAFEISLKINQALGMDVETMRLHAFLAWTLAEMGAFKRALTESAQALKMLEADSPYASAIYWARYKALGSSPKAHEALHQAQEAVMRLANKIKSDDLRKKFLKLPLHHSILEASENAATASIDEEDGEADCYKTLRKVRWPDGVKCLKCGSDNLRPHGNVEQSAEHRYWCRNCKKTFSDRTDTVFAYRNLSMDKMFLVIKGIADNSITDNKTLALATGVHPNSAVKLHKDFSAAVKKDTLVKNLLQHLG